MVDKIFKANPKDMREAVAAALRVINPKASLDILATLKLTPSQSKDTIHLTATDLDKSIFTSFKAEVFSDHAITIPAKKLAEILAVWKDESITLSHDNDDGITHLSGITEEKMRLITLPVLDFPSEQVLNLFDTPLTLSIEAETFIKAFKQVEYAASADIARPVLTGVHLTIGSDYLRMETADGYRLNQVQIDLPADENRPKIDAVIPVKALAIIVSQNKDKEPFQFSFGETGLEISWKNMRYVIRNLEGNYPNTAAIIPKESTTGFMTSINSLYWKLRKARVMANDITHIVILRFNHEQKMLSIEANNGEGSEFYTSSISATALHEAQDILTAYNIEFLLDMLASCDPLDNIFFHMTKQTDPLKVTTSDKNFMALIMPMHIPDEKPPQSSPVEGQVSQEGAENSIEEAVQDDDTKVETAKPQSTSEERIAQIMDLYSQDYGVQEIATQLNLSAQFVRTVLREHVSVVAAE
ncbi:MAG: DNA polymerase III subunit beta [Leptolinea sp.]